MMKPPPTTLTLEELRLIELFLTWVPVSGRAEARPLLMQLVKGAKTAGRVEGMSEARQIYFGSGDPSSTACANGTAGCRGHGEKHACEVVK